MSLLPRLVLMCVAGVAFADEELDLAFDRDVLIIEASQHACYRFDIYLARSSDQQRRGLMHVYDLPQTTGMLFVYDIAGVRSMWMKNTFIPLDISFASADGTIVNIARHTVPKSLKTIRSAEPVTYVLELNAGVTERLHIEPGSRVLWGPIFARSINEQ